MSAATLMNAVTLTTCINYGVSNSIPPVSINLSVRHSIASLFLFQGFGLSGL